MSQSLAAEMVTRHLLALRPDLAGIPGDLDLIENRILDSLHFVEFLLFLEEQTGREIVLEEVSAEDFRTVVAITARFFDAS